MIARSLFGLTSLMLFVIGLFVLLVFVTGFNSPTRVPADHLMLGLGVIACLGGAVVTRALKGRL